MTIVQEYESAEYVDEPTYGEITVLSHEPMVDVAGRPFYRDRVHVTDESDANPEKRQEYESYGGQFETMLKAHPEWDSTTIDEVDGTKMVTVDKRNEPARWLYYDENGEPTQMLDWAASFPTAIALEPLQRLKTGGRRLPGGASDARTKEYFTYMADGIGLRSRAHIYAERLKQQAELSDSDRLSIISLGSGAAVPNIEATQGVEALGKAIDWKFFDFDPEALMFARELIEESGLNGSTVDYGPVTEKDGELIPTGLNYIRSFGIPNESVDVVDALGLWEYLKPEQAQRFAKELYAKVKPGGMMIVSNMKPNRPQRQFNERSVGWPGLYLRGETELLDIVQGAEINTTNVTITHAEDGVYAVMEIKK